VSVYFAQVGRYIKIGGRRVAEECAIDEMVEAGSNSTTRRRRKRATT
jgi:hypothetical protein